MTIVNLKPALRQRPFVAPALFDQLIDAFFNEGSTKNQWTPATLRQPAVNIAELPEAILLELAAPGLEKTDFNIKIEKDQLRISAAKETTKESTEKVKRSEFSYHKFERTFQLPDTIATGQISAEYKNGILKVTLPKKEEAREMPPRTVEIA